MKRSMCSYMSASCGRAFTQLSSIARKRLVDGLCSNLSVLGLSIGALLSVQEPEDASEHEAAATSHRSALKAYVFLLTWLARLAEEEARSVTGTADSTAGEGLDNNVSTISGRFIFRRITCNCLSCTQMLSTLNFNILLSTCIGEGFC